MNIQKDCAVTLRYQLSNAQGTTVDSGHLAYLHGGYENLFPKAEAALEGQAVGYKLQLDLAVEDAFGAYDEALVRTIPKTEFPPGVKVGGMLPRPGRQRASLSRGENQRPASASGRQPPPGRASAAVSL